MLSTILLQAAAGMGVAKMGATIGAGFSFQTPGQSVHQPQR